MVSLLQLIDHHSINKLISMKKLFVVLALAGLVGTASAATVATITKTEIVTVKGGDKKKKKKEKKAECAKGNEANGKACSKEGQAGGCCKDKQQAAAPAPAPVPAPATTDTNKPQ